MAKEQSLHRGLYLVLRYTSTLSCQTFPQPLLLGGAGSEEASGVLERGSSSLQYLDAEASDGNRQLEFHQAFPSGAFQANLSAMQLCNPTDQIQT